MKKRLLYYAAPAVAVVSLYCAVAAKCFGTIISGQISAGEEASHWGLLPQWFIPERAHTFKVKRFVDGKEVEVCVSKSLYDRRHVGDWYFGGY